MERTWWAVGVVVPTVEAAFESTEAAGLKWCQEEPSSLEREVDLRRLEAKAVKSVYRSTTKIHTYLEGAVEAGRWYPEA